MSLKRYLRFRALVCPEIANVYVEVGLIFFKKRESLGPEPKREKNASIIA